MQKYFWQLLKRQLPYSSSVYQNWLRVVILFCMDVSKAQPLKKYNFLNILWQMYADDKSYLMTLTINIFLKGELSKGLCKGVKVSDSV